VFDNERIPLVNAQREIFKPKQMRFLLSIKTVFPKPGGKVWYDDQRHVHRQIMEGDETIDYAFMGQDPNAADNRWLREAYENSVPIIYFLGIAPGRYQGVLPCFISGWDPSGLRARLTFGVPGQPVTAPPNSVFERRYALRTVKQRLHQASFREAVITAYGGRCALSRLPEPVLLDGPHRRGQGRATRPTCSSQRSSTLENPSRRVRRATPADSGRSWVRLGRWICSPFSRFKASSIGPSLRRKQTT
jgi:putative restriction endonuclease